MGIIATGFSNSDGVRVATRIVGITCCAPILSLRWHHIVGSVRVIACGYVMLMFAISATSNCVAVRRKFSDRGLGSTKPAIYGNKWLHVIMTYIIACIVNGYGMCVTAWFKRIVSICSIAITTTRHASVTFIRPAKLKWVHMSTSCTNTCIMCMRWKFSDRKIRKDW